MVHWEREAVVGIQQCGCELCAQRAAAEAKALQRREADRLVALKEYREARHRQQARQQGQEEYREERQRQQAREQEEEERQRVIVTLRIGVFFDGTGNNPSNVEQGIRCGAHHPISPEDLDGSCKPYMGDADSSYGNDITNIKKLFDLYTVSKKDQIETRGLASRRIYIDGIGTQAGAKDSVIGSGIGRGETGVEARVGQAFDRVKAHVNLFLDEHPSMRIAQLVFDIFGFSRGAAAARHFANQVARAADGPLQAALNVPNVFISGFGKQYGDGVQTGFIGLFDTVSAVGGLRNLGYVRSAIAPGLKLHLSPALFPHVVQLAARDEYRSNFPLQQVGPEHPEIVLPGAHSDLGGGYRDEVEEQVMLGPMQALDVSMHVDVKTTSIYRDALQAQVQWHARGWPLEMLLIATPEPLMLPADPQDRLAPRQKRVYAGLQLRRTVSAGLSRVYLRVMYELARKKGAGFDVMDPHDSKFSIPMALQSLSDRFIAGDYSTSTAEEALLKRRYIHASAHWNPAPLTGPRTGKFDLTYLNAPTQDRVRVQHPHTP
ncbi:MAG: DUF2235 domain-containing protein [Pseudomonas sp.]|nr:DUF2235 domain-containing protein [Pseudomonas sp.]